MSNDEEQNELQREAFAIWFKSYATESRLETGRELNAVDVDNMIAAWNAALIWADS